MLKGTPRSNFGFSRFLIEAYLVLTPDLLLKYSRFYNRCENDVIATDFNLSLAKIYWVLGTSLKYMGARAD